MVLYVNLSTDLGVNYKTKYTQCYAMSFYYVFIAVGSHALMNAYNPKRLLKSK